MNHTTNPTDVKIEPQISLIAVNFSYSFSNVISGVKGVIFKYFLIMFMLYLTRSMRD